MEQVTPTTWTAAECKLWRRIEAHDFEPHDQALTFTHRLARDHGWDLGFARSLVNEYRRFCFLAVASGRAVTPSEEVDAVWHQHLTFSRDYWKSWCRTALRTDLHHDPTRGGAAEQTRFAAQYAQTLAIYEAYFGPPNPVAWPGTADRFRSRSRYVTVDRDRTILLPIWPALKRLARRLGGTLGLSSVLATLLPTSARALPLDPFDWTAEPFLGLYVVVILVGVALVVTIQRRLGSDERRPRADGLGAVELAYLAGGATRAADTVILGFMLSGAARLEGSGGLITFDESIPRLPAHLAAFSYHASGTIRRPVLIRQMSARLGTFRDDLIERGLLLDRERTARSLAATVAIMGVVVGFGALKILVGASRDKPVGFLTMLVIAAGFAGLYLGFRAPRRTAAGSEALSDYRARHDRATRAPLDGEIPLAFALMGAAALAGTAYAAYGELLKDSTSSGGDGGGGIRQQVNGR